MQNKDSVGLEALEQLQLRTQSCTVYATFLATICMEMECLRSTHHGVEQTCRISPVRLSPGMRAAVQLGQGNLNNHKHF